jgi:hypothetical protein
MTDADAPIAIETEAFGQARQMSDGFWLLATRHRPGLSKQFFEINNRCLIFRLFDATAGRTCLLVVNAVDPTQSLAEVKRLERETGLAVEYVVSPGGGHHLHMAAWHAELPRAKFLLCPVRTPNTANGRKLLELPRVTLMDAEDPLPQFRGQLEVVLFRGLVGPGDGPSPAEGGPDTMMSMMRSMVHLMRSREPADELWLHHVPTGTVVGGENLAWYYPREVYRKQPFTARRMVKPDRLWIWTMPRKVGEAETVSACWRRILAWPARTVMSFHDALGSAASAGDAQSALRSAVEQSGQLVA